MGYVVEKKENVMKRNVHKFILGFSVIAAFTLQGLVAYGDIPRREFVKLDMNEQKSIYRDMTAEQKEALWEYKFQVSLKDQRLSSAEKQELEKIAEKISNLGFYGNAGDSSTENFIRKWTHRMIEKYGWSDDKLFYYTYTWMTDDELRDYEKNRGLDQDPLRMSSGSEWYEIEQWAQEHFEYYSSCQHREEFTCLPLNKQNALYRLFSRKEKAQLWDIKLDDIRNSIILSEAEKEAVLAYYSKFSPLDMPNEMDESKSDLTRKYNNAKSELFSNMKDKFGWDRRKFWSYCEIWLTEAEWQQYCIANGIKSTF